MGETRTSIGLKETKSTAICHYHKKCCTSCENTNLRRGVRHCQWHIFEVKGSLNISYWISHRRKEDLKYKVEFKLKINVQHILNTSSELKTRKGKENDLLEFMVYPRKRYVVFEEKYDSLLYSFKNRQWFKPSRWFTINHNRPNWGLVTIL